MIAKHYGSGIIGGKEAHVYSKGRYVFDSLPRHTGLSTNLVMQDEVRPARVNGNESPGPETTKKTLCYARNAERFSCCQRTTLTLVLISIEDTRIIQLRKQERGILEEIH
ncbi:hypothetical protein ES702_05671 [subsurface metagenome]